MTHGVRLFSDIHYQGGVVLPDSWWETVDATLAKAINGDGGGSWAPASVIELDLLSKFVLGGPLGLSNGATLSTPLGSGARITLGDSDYVQLAAGHTGATQTPVVDSGEFIATNDLTSEVQYYNAYDCPQTQFAGASSSPRFILPLAVHDGATLTQVTFQFAVTIAHTSSPANLPRFRVVAVDQDGNVTPLWLLPLDPANYSLNGFYPYSPSPGSGAAWFASGATKTFVYAIAAGTVIDASKYTYFAEIIDEFGTNAQVGNMYFAATPTYANIADQRPQ